MIHRFSLITCKYSSFCYKIVPLTILTILSQNLPSIFLCMRMIVLYFEWCNANKMLTWNKSYKNINNINVFMRYLKETNLNILISRASLDMNMLLNELIFVKFVQGKILLLIVWSKLHQRIFYRLLYLEKLHRVLLKPVLSKR